MCHDDIIYVNRSKLAFGFRQPRSHACTLWLCHALLLAPQQYTGSPDPVGEKLRRDRHTFYLIIPGAVYSYENCTCRLHVV